MGRHRLKCRREQDKSRAAAEIGDRRMCAGAGRRLVIMLMVMIALFRLGKSEVVRPQNIVEAIDCTVAVEVTLLPTGAARLAEVIRPDDVI